ncbi:Cullin-4B [Hymenopellis radicata]|nr:Cullin-4B [Hymenopellis radicata]
MRIILSQHDTDSFSYEEVFNACRAAVAAGHGPYLHGALYDAFDKFARELTLELRQDKNRVGRDSVDWLSSFQEKCLIYHDKMRTIQSLYACLDQLYVLKHKGIDSIESMAVAALIQRDSFLADVQVNTFLREGIHSWALWERENRSAHKLRGDVAVVMSQLKMLGQYSIFEKDYIQETMKQYRAFAKARSSLQPQEFFTYLHEQIADEFERTKAVLQVSSWSAIRASAEVAFLEGKMDWLAAGTVGPLINAKNMDMLSSLYQLFIRAGTSEVLCGALRAFVFDTVAAIVLETEPKRQEEMVARLLDFNVLCQRALTDAFADVHPSSTNMTANAKFRQTVHDGFRTGFQKRKNKPAEMIAKYLDKIMRRGQGDKTDKVFHDMLDAALALYRFTDDKDVFRMFYHRQLARRLLMGRSASNDIEMEMLKKLKTGYDAEFGVGEEMFKDLSLSREMVREWHDKFQPGSPERNLNVFVLQHSVWPFASEKATLRLPVHMQSQLSLFDKFYRTKHSARKLAWYHSMGTIDIEGRFNLGQKLLTMSLYQGVILLLFNEEDELSYDTIQAHVGLDDKDLIPVLQSLTVGKKRVLKKNSPGKEVNKGDLFEVNLGFTDKAYKVHINSIQAKISEEESEKTTGDVESDRKHIVQAAIVRIMKAKKEMSYQQLNMAIVDAVKMHFKPSVELIKRQIDWCVEDEYLTRDADDRHKFYYKA